MAVLREQGVNSQVEMAAVFERAGFESHDVHMSDVLSGRVKLADFRGLVACGGFSYGDVLGAGEGWAKSILYHAGARDEFQRFFERADTFTLGVCNGCQMFAALKEIMPGAAHWPRFVRNRGEQFEGRFSLVELQPSPSMFFARHGRLDAADRGRARGGPRGVRRRRRRRAAFTESGLVARVTSKAIARSPLTIPPIPNGSPFGIAAITNADGRVTLTMPHPERSFRYAQNSWRPDGAGEYSGLVPDVRERAPLGGVKNRDIPVSTVKNRICPHFSVVAPDSRAAASSTKNLRTFIACCRRPLRTYAW